MMAMVQRWVFTVGGQPQINDSLGPLLTHFFSPELCHILKIGTTAHLGLVRAKDTRYAKLGREENRGAPPHLQPQPEPGASDVVWSKVILTKPGSLKI